MRPTGVLLMSCMFSAVRYAVSRCVPDFEHDDTACALRSEERFPCHLLSPDKQVSAYLLRRVRRYQVRTKFQARCRDEAPKEAQVALAIKPGPVAVEPAPDRTR